jgi:hypothetical protein
MIVEFAIEPELMASCGRPIEVNFMLQAFGLGTPRIFSEYPKASWWKSEAAKHVQKQIQHKKITPLEVTRVTELIKMLSLKSTKLRSSDDYKNDWGWSRNVVPENANKPFHAVLLRNKMEGIHNAITIEDLVASNLLWDLPTSKTISRLLEHMLKSIKQLILKANHIVFVDPYYTNYNGGHVMLLSAILKLIKNRPDSPVLELHCKYESSGRGSMAKPNDLFVNDITTFLKSCLQPEQTIKVVRWEQRGGGEKLHDRYILTDLGGIKFSQGLEVGQLGETNDLDILNKDQFELRWKQYVSEPAFNLAPDHNSFEVKHG